MGQKRLSVVAVTLSVVVSGSVALALDSLGAPKAGPAAGQFEIGGDFLYGAMDLNFHDWYRNLPSGSEKRITTHSRNQPTSKAYANLGYGVLGNWEAFLRLGGADSGMGAGTMFAVGGGTKVTFYETGKWSFGGILQASWAGADEELKAYDSHGGYGESLSQFSVTEVQSALGVCCQLNPQVKVYGGPFVAFVEGTAEYKTADPLGAYSPFYKTSRDVDETSCLGGYLGVQAEIHANVLANVEYQHTGGADAVAVGLVYRFGLSQ